MSGIRGISRSLFQSPDQLVVAARLISDAARRSVGAAGCHTGCEDVNAEDVVGRVIMYERTGANV